MNYEEAMNFIQNTSKFGSVLGLDNIRELLERLGNPQDQLRVVHIAGTNGKGSTLAFLAGIFTGAGYVVESNKEHGEGRSDVIVYDSENGQLALFEVKYSSTLDQMKQSCQKALAQIDEKMYAKEFEDSYDKILCYGIAFFKKRCLVYLKD